MDSDALTAIISTAGISGVLVWFLYYTTTTTLPNLTQTYTESNERQSTKFAETQLAISNKFADTLKEEREYRKQEIAALQQWIKHEASCRYNQDH